MSGIVLVLLVIVAVPVLLFAFLHFQIEFGPFSRKKEAEEREEKTEKQPEPEPGPACEEHARKIMDEKIGIPESCGEYPQLKKHLVAFLSGEDDIESLYRWAGLLSTVVMEQVDRKIEEKKSEWEAEREENSKMSLDRAMAKAVKSGFLTLSDGTAIKILEALERKPSSFSTLEDALGSDGEARWRLEWLESLGLVEGVGGGVESGFYKPTERGENMLRRVEGPPSSSSPGDQRRRLAEMAAGENTTADELLNILDGNWLEKHRGELEKIRKKYGDPLVGISESFWLERESGDPHLKHAEVDIADHEASGALLCLALLDMHAKEGESGKSQNAWRSLFEKAPAGA